MNRYAIKFRGIRVTDTHLSVIVEAWTRKEAQKLFEKTHPYARVESITPIGKETDGIDWAAMVLVLGAFIALGLFYILKTYGGI